MKISSAFLLLEKWIKKKGPFLKRSQSDF